MAGTFIPRPECTVMSGHCFLVGACLGNCRPRVVTPVDEQRVREIVREEIARALAAKDATP